MQLKRARAICLNTTLAPLVRAGLGRYAILHEHGGLYIDADAQLLLKGADAVKNAMCVGEALVFGDRYQS